MRCIPVTLRVQKCRTGPPESLFITSCHIWLVTLHSPVDTLRDGWLLSTAFDSLEESEPTPPDTWLPQSLHSALGLWEPRLVLPRTGALPSHVPVTSPLSKADAEVCSRCSAGTRGCRSSSSEMANTGTLM